MVRKTLSYTFRSMTLKSPNLTPVAFSFGSFLRTMPIIFLCCRQCI